MKTPFDAKFWLFLFAGVFVVVAGEGIVIYWSLDWYWAVAIFTPALLCFSHIQTKHKKQLFEEHFRGRPTLDEGEFGRHYFSPEKAEIAGRLREILADYVGIDLSRMNPSDRFIEDLRMEDFDSMATVEFIIAIEKEFEIEIPNSVVEKMTTFQSVVDYVTEAVKNKQSQSHGPHPRKN